MPIYEYLCKACDTRLEVLQKINDDPLTTCPECGGNLEKQWSLSGFQFKGSGWYVTDYARKGSAESGKKEGSSGEKAQSAATAASANAD